MKQLFKIRGSSGIDRIVAVPATVDEDDFRDSRYMITRLVGETGEQVVLDYMLKSEVVTECFDRRHPLPERQDDGTILVREPNYGRWELELPADFPPHLLGYIKMAYWGGFNDGSDFKGSPFDVKPGWQA